MVLALLSAGPPVRLSAQTIDTIVVVSHNVFASPQDGEDPGFLGRLANALHVTTRSGVIRGALLVNPGDPYDSARVAESERALRGLYIFSRVQIDTTRIGDRLALRVETTDGWSTKLQLGYSTAGGDARWLAGIVEQNLLGTATALTAVYSKTPDRGTGDFSYVNRHFYGRRTLFGAEYSRKSDGNRGQWIFGVPFSHTGARRAFTTEGEAASENVLLFREGARDTDRARGGMLERRALHFGVAAGYAPHATSRSFVRIWAAGQWRREDFADSTAIPFSRRSVFGSAGVGLDFAHVRFQVLERFNSYARREDVDLSHFLRVGVWAAPRAWGYPGNRAGVGPELNGQVSVLWQGGFAVLRGAANGVYTADGLDSARATGGLTVASQNLRRHTLIFHVEGGALRRVKPDAEFDLWVEQRGPRLFGIHQFTGTRMAWLAVEDRILLSDELWGLLGLGVAPFVDYGGAWYAGDRAVGARGLDVERRHDRARLGGNVGVALRLGPTRAGRGEAGEIALGYRFGDGFTGWGLSVGKGFAF